MAILLNNGKIDLKGEVHSVITKYLNRNTNQLKSNSINLKSVIIEQLIASSINGPKNVIRLGDEVSIKLIYHNKHARNLQVAIHVKNERDELITTFNSKLKGISSFNCFESGVIECKIDRWSILQGCYNLDLWLKVDDEDHYFNNLKSFDIVNSDYFGSGKLPKANGIMVMEHSFTSYKQ